MKKEAKAGKPDQRLGVDLDRNRILLREKLWNSADLTFRPVEIGGIEACFVLIEGMCSLSKLGDALIRPLSERVFPSGQALFDFVGGSALVGDVKPVCTFEEVIQKATSGFAVLLIQGVAGGLALGAQSFPYRSVSEPDGEVNEKGAKESFTEPLKVNLTLIRRRMKSGQVAFEELEVGTTTKTGACLVYSPQAVSREVLSEVRKRLLKVPLELVLDVGYLKPFLEGKPLSLFSEVGTTERPDTLCAKILEGRVAILLDGTPHALIVPCLFTENFQSFDDYCSRPYFATFIRLLKYGAFFLSILLPGLYVAVATFHPAVLPHALLFNVAAADEATPFPLMIEALVIHLIFEIMREAGLRLPRPVGQAVGIVGALVIGDAAVTAGIIGAPMVMIVALTAISSFVVPSLYAPGVILRFLFILLGGWTGLYGISLALGVLLVNVCQIRNLGVPFTAPVSPVTPKALRDVFWRASWKKMTKPEKIQNLRGSEASRKPMGKEKK